MKQLIWKLVLPLTIISFVTFTKWWYVELDGSNEILTGFPLPYKCPGWHTSLSLQIFVIPLIIDFITYFLFWLIIIIAINKFIWKIKVSKIASTVLISITCLLSMGKIIAASNSDNIYSSQRNFEIEVLESGYKFLWQNKSSSDYMPEQE